MSATASGTPTDNSVSLTHPRISMPLAEDEKLKQYTTWLEPRVKESKKMMK